MIIDRKIEKYIVFREDPIRAGLEKMDASNMRILFVVNEKGTLDGIITDIFCCCIIDMSRSW